MQIKKEDFRYDVFRNGAGSSFGVKVTHIPTGLNETCDINKSEHLNRETARNKLIKKLNQST